MENQKENQNEDRGKKRIVRKRSPNYPFESLPKAIERVKYIYKRYVKHYVPIRILHELWGYKPLSGTIKQIVAALDAYGLIETKGHGDMKEIRISDEGYRIIENAPDKDNLLQGAALSPSLYQKVWEKYSPNGLPSDSLLREYLIWELNFNKDSVDIFINNLRETLELAKLISSDIINAPEQGGAEMNVATNLDKKDEFKDKQSLNYQPPKSGLRSLNLTLKSGATASIQIPHTISKKEFEILKSSLSLFEEDLFSGTNNETKSEP